MLIKAIPRFYFGYLQGFKVYINKKKYPRRFGFFYTTLDIDKAIELAKKEMKSND